ncbi:MAG: recombinase family protein [Clostridia bacterium]|nr:recombinase family protein [Clostridia bacterium]
MKTAVIYARYSSERQTEQSIEGQLRVCNEYAKNNDLLIVDTYIDRAMTGTNDNRKDFQRMLKESAKRKWEVVLVYKLDRFSRNKYEMATHKKQLKDYGVRLVSAMENIPDTPEGIILESLLEGMAEYYSAELSQKVRRGMNETRQKGNYTGGTLIYGYKIQNKKVVIDEDKAEIVRYIYQRYAEGAHVKDIIIELNEKGAYNRGKPFARNTVFHILENEKYSGVYHYNNQEYTNIYPQIVPTEIFEKIQAEKIANKYGKRNNEFLYLLKNKLFCGYCGRPITAETGTSHTKAIMRYYKCSGKKRGINDCTKKPIRKDLIETTVILATQQLLKNSKIIDNIADAIVGARKAREKDQSILNILREEKAKTEKSIDNIVDAVEKGLTSKATQKRLDELETKLENLEIKIATEECREIRFVSKEDITKYLNYAIKQEPKTLIDLLIKKVVLFDDNIDIYYNYTDKVGPDEDSRDSLISYGSTRISDLPPNAKNALFSAFSVCFASYLGILRYNYTSKITKMYQEMYQEIIKNAQKKEGK